MFRIFSSPSSSSTSKPQATTEPYQHHDHSQHHHRRERPSGHARVFYAGKTAHRKRSIPHSSEKHPTKPSACVDSRTTTRKSHTLTRTRSESDLIRARAKEKTKQQESCWDDNDEDGDSSDSSLDSVDEYGRVATSLRSFHTEDEERFAKEHAMQFQEMTSIHKQKQSKALEVTPEESVAGRDATLGPSTATNDQTQGTVAVAESTALPNVSAASHSHSHSNSGSATTSSEARGSYHRETIASSTTMSSQLMEANVDLEYLLHENDLLQKSLQDVTADRNRLAQENWMLRYELERVRYQLQRSVVSSHTTAPTTPTATTAARDSHNTIADVYPTGSSPPPAVYPTSSPSSYSYASAGDYAYHGHFYQPTGTTTTTTTTFEDLFHETR